MTEKEKSLWRAGHEVISILSLQGYKAYIVGGSVRDKLLGKEIKDIDVTTNAPMDKIESLFETHDIGKSKDFGIVVIKSPSGVMIEVAQFRKDEEYTDGRHPDVISILSTFKEDTKRRDFTINAMAYDSNNKLIDYHNGKKDLDMKKIRTVGDPNERFNEDKLRMLRAIRFATILNFDIESKTGEAINKHSKEIQEVSAERIKMELDKILESNNRANGIDMLFEYGLLFVILPELEMLLGCPQNPIHHPEGDVWAHTLLALEKYHGNINGAWAMLLHDIGKPLCTTQENGIIHSKGHEAYSEEIAEIILKRLKFSVDDTKEILYCIKNHMVFHDIIQMKKAKAKRFIAEPYFDTLMDVCIADRERLIPGIEFTVQKNLNKINELLKEPIQAQKVSNKGIVSGNDIMATLNIKPGPKVGEIKDKIQDLYLAGEIKDENEALEYLKTLV